MNDPTILFVKPKAISAKDKKALQTAGVIVVEVEDVNSVKFVRAGTELSSTTLLHCATTAIGKYNSDSLKAAFANAVIAALDASYSRKAP